MLHLRRAVAFVALLLLTAAARGTEILHLDLRQPGSATIILQPTSKGLQTIVVDFGASSRDRASGGWRVLDALREQCAQGDQQGPTIDHVDLAIVTHTDRDHFGGIAHLLASEDAVPSDKTPEAVVARGPPAMPIHALLVPRWTPTTALGKRMIALAAKRKIPQFTPGETDTAQEFEEQYGIRIFAAASPRTTNDSSIVVAVYDSERAGIHLITGDVTRKSWEEIAPRIRALGRTVLSVTAPHHGGDVALLDIIDDFHPETIVFSANRDNPYRHPSLKLFRELARRNPSWRLRGVEAARQQAIAEDEAVLQLRQEIVEAVYNGLDAAGKQKVRASVYGDFSFEGSGERAYSRLDYDAENSERVRLGMSPKQWKQLKRLQQFRERIEREHASREAAHDSAADPHRKAVETFVADAQSKAWNAGTQLRATQLVLTGEAGDVAIGAHTAEPLKPASALDTFFAEAIFRQMAHLSDREVAVLKTVPRARAYCLLKVHADLATVQARVKSKVARPAWVTDYELIVKDLFPGATRARIRAHVTAIAVNTRREAIAPMKALGAQGNELFQLYRETIAESEARRQELRTWMHDVIRLHRDWVAKSIRQTRPYGQRISIPAPIFPKTEVDLPNFPDQSIPPLDLPGSARTFDTSAIDPTRDPLALFDHADYERRVEAARVKEIQRERFQAEKRFEHEVEWRRRFEAEHRGRR